MTKQEIQDINKLIFELLGCEIYIGYQAQNYIEYTVKGDFVKELRTQGLNVRGFDDSTLLSNAHFHDDWNWLMLVVEKIESLNDKEYSYSWEVEGKTQYNFMNYIVEISACNCYIMEELTLDPPEMIANCDAETKILATYTAVNQFIEYRKQLVKENGNTNQCIKE